MDRILEWFGEDTCRRRLDRIRAFAGDSEEAVAFARRHGF